MKNEPQTISEAVESLKNKIKKYYQSIIENY